VLIRTVSVWDSFGAIAGKKIELSKRVDQVPPPALPSPSPLAFEYCEGVKNLKSGQVGGGLKWVTVGLSQIQSAQHDTIPASSVPPGGGMHGGVPGPDHPAIQVNADELLDPPVTAGCAADLNSGRSLLMVVGMQKIMPRPTGYDGHSYPPSCCK
jgi:hypothetical protein